MKKWLVLLVSLLLAVFASLTACGDRSGNHTHTYASEWSYDDTYHWHAATCAHDGKEGDKALHVFTVKERKKADCESGGYTLYECACGYSYKEDETPASEHNYAVVTVAPTCTEGGYTLHKCLVCGDEYRTDETEMLGHNLIDYAGKLPTCTEDGSGAYQICTRCDYATDGETIVSSGHKFSPTVWAFDENTHWHPAICAHTDEKYGVSPHNFANGAMCVCGYVHPSADPDAFEFAVSSSGGYAITGIKESATVDANLILPATYNGQAVTAIADAAFGGNTTLVKVTVPFSIKSIGREAFYGCSSLATVNLEAGLTEIGYTAFAGCTALTEIEIPETVKTIRSYAFEGCTQLSEIDIPSSVTVLGDQVFRGCAALASIAMPSGITEIGNYTFYGCSSLSAVEIPSTVKNIGVQAFAGCVALTSVQIPNGVAYIGQKAFAGSGLTSVTLPDTVTRLSSYAFEGCVSLRTVVLSRGLTFAIADWFSGCSAIESISLPFVGDNNDKTLATATVFGFIFGTKVPSEVTKFDAVTRGGKTYYIPKSLTTVTVTGVTKGGTVISAGAFDGCASITSITLSSGVAIEDGWLGDCPATVTK